MDSKHAVEYSDDLLIEILLWLPVISLLRFKSVCKRWLSLIRNASFSLRRNQMPTFDPPRGLILPSGLPNTYEFLSLDTRSPYERSSLKTNFTFRSELHDVTILQSSNGLLLCRGGINNDYKYYVYNPCTNLFKMLPQCLNKIIYHTQIAFDPTKSPHYKVIQIISAVFDDFYTIQIQTYSSETRNWSFCSDKYPKYSFANFDNGIYWNDAICWLNSECKPILIFKLDINGEHQALTTILGPFGRKVTSEYNHMIFESRGCLLLLILSVDRFGYSRHINVYEMRNELSGWSIKYSVNLDDITRQFPKEWNIYSSVRSIVLGDSEEDSFMLIEHFGKLVQYKTVLKTSRVLCELGIVGINSAIFHFTASFANAGV